MAGVYAHAVTGEVVTGTSAKTILQVVAPAAQRLRVRRISITFDGVLATAEPIKVRVLRQTSAGTMSELSPVSVNPAGVTVRATAQHTATVEPTASDVIRSFNVHPQGGYAEILPPDLPIEVAESGRLGIEVTAAASVNAIAEMGWEE